MKILHILNTATFSGAENVAITIINNYTKNINGAYASLDGPIKIRLEEENIQYYPMKKMSIKGLKKIINDYRPDVIHSHDFTTSVVASLTNTKVPIVSHLHNNVPWLKRPGPYSITYLLSSTKYEQILGVSNSIFEEYIFGDLIHKKTKVISNPIDTSEVVRKAQIGRNESYDIVFLGRISSPKNPLKFIDLMKVLVERFPELRVAMIGSGNLEKECVSRINELKLNNNIRMLGFMENPYGILKSSKVLCMTSSWEGFGLVAVEALALGTPVVAYPVGGLTGIINKSCGRLVSTDDEYIEEIEKLVRDPEYLSLKSYNAKEKAQELNNIDKYMDDLINLYTQISSLS